MIKINKRCLNSIFSSGLHLLPSRFSRSLVSGVSGFSELGLSGSFVLPETGNVVGALLRVALQSSLLAAETELFVSIGSALHSGKNRNHKMESNAQDKQSSKSLFRLFTTSNTPT